MATPTYNPGDHSIVTFTGRRFCPLQPRIEDIDILDIAHALSHNCRFTGHVREFYSVGEHSVRCAWEAPHELKLTMLLHDASEAYLSDLARPVKHDASMKPYREAEDRLQTLIGKKFGVEFTDPRIHEIDNRMLMTERRDLMPPSSSTGWTAEQPYPGKIKPYHCAVAKRFFMEEFNALIGHATLIR